MKCDRCGKETKSLTISAMHEGSLCNDCNRSLPIPHGERRVYLRESTSSPDLSRRPESVTANFETETPIRFDYTESSLSQRRRTSQRSAVYLPDNTDLGRWTDDELREFMREDLGERFPTSRVDIPRSHWDGARAQLHRRKETIIAQRQNLAAKDDIIRQLRERLDRAKRGR